MEKAEFQKWLKANKPNLTVSKYIGFSKSCTVDCSCGRTWTTSPKCIYYRSKSTGCMSCSGKNKPKNKDYLEVYTKQGLNKWLKINKPTLTCLSFDTFNTLGDFRCNCGREWSAHPRLVYNAKGTGCRTCSHIENDKESLPQRQRAYEKLCKKLKLKPLEPFQGMNGPKILHECLKCGYTWNARCADICEASKSRNGQFNRCMECRKKYFSDISSYDFEVYIKRIHKHKKVKVLSVDKETGYKVQCLRCNRKWIGRRDDLCRGVGCKECGVRISLKYRSKPYLLGTRTVMVQGYEDLALDILQNNGISPKDIVVASEVACPVILLPNNKRYYPDIFLPKKNTLIEVKSVWTAGLTRKGGLEHLKNKAKYSIKQGYTYYVWVLTDEGIKLPLPKDWLTMTRKQICLYLNIPYINYKGKGFVEKVPTALFSVLGWNSQ